MARGRGGSGGDRGNPGRGRQSGPPTRSRTLPPISRAAASPDFGSCCGLCNARVDSDAIGCDRCDRWYNPLVMCMGIPEEVIENIKQYGGEGVSYVCTVCRSGNSKGGENQSSALGQLLQTVSKLCENVRKLSEVVVRPQPWLILTRIGCLF